jgi:tetratricopeptide (TPR) repeat protein
MRIDPIRAKFDENAQVGKASSKLPLEFSMFAAMGFRQAVAGLLWVRTDNFFHEGNYDAIIPMVRLITWLDPQNTDVYETGAWHLDYNFTDADQRSDRRYLPLSVSLLEEAIKNNPTVTKLYADLAFTHYFRKMANFQQSVYWYEQAQALKATDPKTGKNLISPSTGQTYSLADPTIVGHGLAHAYAANGDVDKAIAEWEYCLNEHRRIQKDAPNDPAAFQEKQSEHVAQRNLYELQMRKVYRVKDTQPPYDVNLDAHLVRTAPMHFLFTGSANIIGSTAFKLETHSVIWGPQDGARINIQIADADYVQPQEQNFELNVNLPKNVTILQDSASMSFKKGTKQIFFKKDIDMSKDHVGDNPMYPFKSKRYKVTMWINPADPNSFGPSLQDRSGWVGEGITDKRYNDISGNVPGALLGPNQKLNVHLIKKVIYLTQDDIMGKDVKTF